MTEYFTSLLSFSSNHLCSGLSEFQLKQLAQHKYNASGSSLLEPLFQPFWRWLIEKLPLTWAPNSITIIGLLANILTSIILFIYSPDGMAKVSSWALVLCAVGLFIYQTMDALDGKQARRTNSSSSLGELFDHGCDAVSISFIIIASCVSLELGAEPSLMIFQSFAAMFLFYIAHWQTYCSGKLKFGSIDVTEGQISIILIYLISAIFGTQIWAYKIPLLKIAFNRLPVYFSIVGALISCISNFRIIFMQGGVGRNGSTVAGTSVLSPIIPIASLLMLGIMIWVKSPTVVFRSNLVLFLLMFGVASAKISTKLVIAHMSCTEMERFDISLLGPGALFLNQYFDTFLDEFILLVLCFTFCCMEFVLYFSTICNQMADHLNVRVFHLRQRRRKSSVVTDDDSHPTDDISSRRGPIVHDHMN